MLSDKASRQSANCAHRLGKLSAAVHICNQGSEASFGVQLDDSFATALPLLRSISVEMYGYGALETTAKVVMLYLVELTIAAVNVEYLDLRFMSALKSLSLLGCTVSTVSAACSTMRLDICRMREGTVLVTPNLRSLTIDRGGLHKLDGSRCQHALSILCMNRSFIDWVGAMPNVEQVGCVLSQEIPFLVWLRQCRTGFCLLRML